MKVLSGAQPGLLPGPTSRCLHSGPSTSLSRHAAECGPFKRGVECGDPKTLKLLARRITGQIPELGCHGEKTVQTAVAGVAAARALGWESAMC